MVSRPSVAPCTTSLGLFLGLEHTSAHRTPDRHERNIDLTMPHIIGGSQRVVDHEGLTIDELAGNVATSSDRISIAHVKVANPSSEPWLTLDYDEWMCVLKGRMVLLYGDGKELEVKQGQTVMIERGERFRPMFPDPETEYIPVCLPAFRPDRCIREEEAGGSVSAKLAMLHSNKRPQLPSADDPKPEVLYHMVPTAQWEAAKATGSAYYPTTFHEDGDYTHATAVPSRLITTANHFYQDVAGEWVCLRFTRSALRRCGIVVRDEEAKPVGNQPVGEDWGDWVCPHVLGGIPPMCVDKEFPMSRNGKAFEAIIGLTDGQTAEPPAKKAK